MDGLESYCDIQESPQSQQLSTALKFTVYFLFITVIFSPTSGAEVGNDMVDYYDILGVSRTASPDDIKKA